MSKIKKIIRGGFEFIRDSGKQIAETVSPGSLIESAMSPKSKETKDEVTEYLQKLSPDMSKEELEKKKKDLSEKDLEVMVKKNPKHLLGI